MTGSARRFMVHVSGKLFCSLSFDHLEETERHKLGDYIFSMASARNQLMEELQCRYSDSVELKLEPLEFLFEATEIGSDKKISKLLRKSPAQLNNNLLASVVTQMIIDIYE